MHTSVIIVNFCTAPLVARLLTSLEEFPPPEPWEVLLINNSPDEQSALEIAVARHPRVRLLSVSRNTYFAPACNFAARHARGRYLAFLNPDTVFRSPGLHILTDFLDMYPDYVGAGGSILDTETGIRTPTGNTHSGFGTDLFTHTALGRAARLLHWTPRWLRVYRYDDWDRETDRDVEAACNAFFVVRREVFQHIGGYSEKLLLFYSEDDLGRKIRRIGGRLRHCADATLWHTWSSSTRHLPAAKVRALQLWDRYHHFRPILGLPRSLLLAGLTALLHPATLARLPATVPWLVRLRREWREIAVTLAQMPISEKPHVPEKIRAHA